MAIKADAVANFFIDAAKREGKPITAMQVQKLSFIAHGFYLALQNAPLIDEPIQAWKWGPVIYSIYAEFREFGGDPITKSAMDIDFKDNTFVLVAQSLPADAIFERDLMEQVWKVYGRYTGIQLSNLTHQTGSPWDQIVKACDGNLPRGITIPNDAIRNYYKALLESSQTTKV